MPRGPIWTDTEKQFLTGVLASHGDKPRSWPEEVKTMVRERLANRTESGIYQQCLQLIKARKIAEDNTPTERFHMARGA